MLRNWKTLSENDSKSYGKTCGNTAHKLIIDKVQKPASKNLCGKSSKCLRIFEKSGFQWCPLPS